MEKNQCKDRFEFTRQRVFFEMYVILCEPLTRILEKAKRKRCRTCTLEQLATIRVAGEMAVVVATCTTHLFNKPSREEETVFLLR